MSPSGRPIVLWDGETLAKSKVLVQPVPWCCHDGPALWWWESRWQMVHTFLQVQQLEPMLEPSALIKGELVLTLSPNKTPVCFCSVSYLWQESWLVQTSAMLEGWWSPLKPSVPWIVPRSVPWLNWTLWTVLLSLAFVLYCLCVFVQMDVCFPHNHVQPVESRTGALQLGRRKGFRRTGRTPGWNLKRHWKSLKTRVKAVFKSLVPLCFVALLRWMVVFQQSRTWWSNKHFIFFQSNGEI